MILSSKQSVRWSLSRGLCAFLAALFTFYCDSFLSLVQARSDDSPLRRAEETEARNRLDSWDRPFGAVLSEAKTALFHYDGQLSTRQLTDSGAQVTDYYTYDAFGILLSLPGPTLNNYLYTGEQHDQSIGLYYLRTRYMYSSIGRFMSEDHARSHDYDPQSLHKYLYVLGNPIIHVDYSGMLAFSLTDVLITSAVFGILSGLTSSCLRILTGGTIGQAMIDFVTSFSNAFFGTIMIAYGVPPPLAFAISSGAVQIIVELVSGNMSNDPFFAIGRVIIAILIGIAGPYAFSKFPKLDINRNAVMEALKAINLATSLETLVNELTKQAGKGFAIGIMGAAINGIFRLIQEAVDAVKRIGNNYKNKLEQYMPQTNR